MERRPRAAGAGGACAWHCLTCALGVQRRPSSPLLRSYVYFDLGQAHGHLLFIIIAELAPPWLFRLGPHLRFMIDSRALLSSSTCTSPLRRQHIPVGEGDRGARELKPDILFGFFDKDIYLCANPNIKTLGAHHSADPSYLARLRTLCKAADTMDDSWRCVRCFKAVSWTHPHCPHCGGR